MLNATAPNIPNQDVVFEAPSPNNPKPEMKIDPIRWYQFLNTVEEFLITLRNFPPRVEQADLAALLRKLIKAQFQPGVQVFVPVYNHMMRFTGSGWSFAPGDIGSDFVVTFLSPPTADGWQVCDGTVGVTYLLSDGTIGTRTVPNTATLYFRR